MADKTQMKEITEKLKDGIHGVFESDQYANYLKTMSKFHSYSTNNTLLIHMQRPGATNVAGAYSWNTKFKRLINKGEKAIKIFAPAPFVVREEKEQRDPDTNMPVLDENGMPIIETLEKRFARFKVVNVFDVSQTNGKPLPNLAQDLSGDVEQYNAFMDACRAVSNLPIVIEPLPGGEDGICRFGDRISVREGMSQIQTVSATIHEMTHAKLHDRSLIVSDDDNDAPVIKDRRTQEVEAESISYAVCQYFGIETGDNSFGYVAAWSKGQELKELNASLDAIRKTASELIDAIDGKFQELVKERNIVIAIGEEQEPLAPEMPLEDILNNREEMIRRIMKEVVKDDPGYPVRALKDMENNYQEASMDGLREAYFFFFPNNTPEINRESLSVPETVNYKIGDIVLMPLLFNNDGNLERTNKRMRVRVEPSIGKYQIYSREHAGTTHGYIMTDSGKLINLGGTYDSLKNVSEKQLDDIFARQHSFVEEKLQKPNEWVDYSAAAIVNRIDEAETHNESVKAAREKEQEQEQQEKSERRK